MTEGGDLGERTRDVPDRTGVQNGSSGGNSSEIADIESSGSIPEPAIVEPELSSLSNGSVGSAEDVRDELDISSDDFGRLLADHLSPEQFEHFVADLWEECGYDVSVRKRSGDKGVDVMARGNGEKIALQAKLYDPEKSAVGGPDVREYHALLEQENADRVVIVNTGEFSSQAKELKDDLDVEFVDAQQLSRIVADRGLDDLVAERVNAGSVNFTSSSSPVWTLLRYSWAAVTFFVGAVLIPLALLGFVSTSGDGSSGSTGGGFLGAALLLYMIASFILHPVSLYRRGHQLGTYSIAALVGYLGLNFLQGVVPYGQPLSFVSLTALGFIAGVYLSDELLPTSSFDHEQRFVDPTSI